MDPISVPKSTDPRRIPFEGIVLAAHQAEFMPYLGNISKAAMGDVYFILDNLQFEKQHWQSRNRIRVKGGHGWEWLIIPLKDVKNHILMTNEIQVDGDKWKKRHLMAIKFSYQRAPYFEDIYKEIAEIYCKDHTFLVDFLLDLILFAFSKFNINIPVYRASDLVNQGYSIHGKKSDLVINMCKAVNANAFVFGIDGRTYIDKEVFYQNKIKFMFQDFVHPVYSQIHGEFTPYMSFIDLLFNYGPESVKIIGKSNYLEE